MRIDALQKAPVVREPICGGSAVVESPDTQWAQLLVATGPMAPLVGTWRVESLGSPPATSSR